METIYAALLLHKNGKDIDEKNIKSVLTAAGVDVDESKVKSLITSLKGVDITKELESASLMAAAPAASAEVKKEEKPKEEKKAAAAEGLSALFG
ncbi:50S ribosomal protein P1 [Candidatus Pacearchaeota archaeon]|nr:50S ribosomal protein P1 [Candidatus Pacearchaeota archaeon]